MHLVSRGYQTVHGVRPMREMRAIPKNVDDAVRVRRTLGEMSEVYRMSRAQKRVRNVRDDVRFQHRRRYRFDT